METLETRTGRNITRKDGSELTITLVKLEKTVSGKIDFHILFDGKMAGKYRTENSARSNFRKLSKIYFG